MPLERQSQGKRQRENHEAVRNIPPWSLFQFFTQIPVLTPLRDQLWLGCKSQINPSFPKLLLAMMFLSQQWKENQDSNPPRTSPQLIVFPCALPFYPTDLSSFPPLTHCKVEPFIARLCWNNPVCLLALGHPDTEPNTSVFFIINHFQGCCYFFKDQGRSKKSEKEVRNPTWGIPRCPGGTEWPSPPRFHGQRGPVHHRWMLHPLPVLLRGSTPSPGQQEKNHPGHRK